MTAGSAHSDETLMGLLASGQDAALAELVRRYQNDVFRFCLQYLKNVESAEDMAQETFLRIYAAKDRFDANRKFKPWMLRIARNLCLNALRRTHLVQMEALDALDGPMNDIQILGLFSETPQDRFVITERRRVLLEAIDTLNGESREIIVLRYFQRMSARDIAEIMDSTEGAVRTRLHRILKQLREHCAPLEEHL